MSCFAPYIDESGLHMPTYEDRLEALAESYRSVFGLDAELSPAVPDYQLLSVFARALDDTSQLVLDAYNSRNPLYARGHALDLLLPLYGLRRRPGETDAAARSRILAALAGPGRTMVQSLEAEILAAGAAQAAIHVNDTAATDARGVPAHSLACIVQAGRKQDIAEAIFRKKAPGIGTHGSTSVSVTDEYGHSRTVKFSRPDLQYAYTSVSVTAYGGYDPATADVIKSAVADYIHAFRIGQPLVVPLLFGVIYTAAGEHARTFAITDVLVTCPFEQASTRTKVNTPWNGLLECYTNDVTVTVTQG